jgi:hypothetical protein
MANMNGGKKGVQNMHHEMFKMFVGDELAKEIFSC